MVQSKSKSLSPQEVPFSSKFRKGFKTHPLQKQQNGNVPVTTQIQNAAQAQFVGAERLRTSLVPSLLAKLKFPPLLLSVPPLFGFLQLRFTRGCCCTVRFKQGLPAACQCSNPQELENIQLCPTALCHAPQHLHLLIGCCCSRPP